MTAAIRGAFLGLVWDDAVELKFKRVMMTNPRAGMANLAAAFKVSLTTMRGFIAGTPEAQEALEAGRAMGDNMVSDKNFSLAMKGDSKSLDREMKKRGMIGNDLMPMLPPERKRDYSKLTVEQLEQLEALDAATRITGPSEGPLREIAPPLHS